MTLFGFMMTGVIFTLAFIAMLQGDYAFRVMGVADSPSDCVIVLLSEDGVELDRTSTVSGEFVETFVVALCDCEYIVQPVCNGKSLKSARITGTRSKLRDYYGEPYNLGALAR
jgi:hypothetical protein